MQRAPLAPQTDFLIGLKNLINLAKRLRLPVLENLSLHKRHLPGGVCKGFSINVALLYTPADLSKFLGLYNAIVAFKDRQNPEEWIRQNPKTTTLLLTTADRLLDMHNMKHKNPNSYDTDYKARTGMNYEVACTVAISDSKADLELQNFLQDICTTSKNYQPHVFLFSNGPHMIPVTIHYSNGGTSFIVCDSNDPTPFITADIAQLAKDINRRYAGFNRHAGEALTYSVAVLSHQVDHAFETLFNQLKTHRDYLPDDNRSVTSTTLIEDKSPKKALTDLINNFEKGQSKVGFLCEVLLRPITSLTPELKKQINAYLHDKPVMFKVLEKQKHLVNTPARNGYTWLHQAVMTNEGYVVWWLLNKLQANPNLTTPLTTQGEQLVTREKFPSPTKPAAIPVILAPMATVREVRDDQDVEIIDIYFEQSTPLMFAVLADNLEIFQLLRDAGANLDARCGNRPDGRSVRDLIRPGSRIGDAIRNAPMQNRNTFFNAVIETSPEGTFLRPMPGDEDLSGLPNMLFNQALLSRLNLNRK